MLVTGGAGFIGSHVAEAHLLRGDEVWIVDDLSWGRKENVPAGAVFHEMDVADARIGDLIGDSGINLVNHQAAQASVPASVADPVSDVRANVLGLVNVLEGARRAGASRVLFPSSCSIYADDGPDPGPRREADAKRPLSTYAASKLAGEQYLACYRETHGLESAAMRYANVYGPRQSLDRTAGVVSTFSCRLVRGEPLVVVGDGLQSRDYVFVADVVAANLMLADAPLPRDRGVDGRAFNVGCGTRTTVVELADGLERISGAGAGRTHVDAQAGEARHVALSPAKLREATGWSPRTSLAEGLEATFDYVAQALASP